jgi:hypothetical protein
MNWECWICGQDVEEDEVIAINDEAGVMAHDGHKASEVTKARQDFAEQQQKAASVAAEKEQTR